MHWLEQTSELAPAFYASLAIAGALTAAVQRICQRIAKEDDTHKGDDESDDIESLASDISFEIGSDISTVSPIFQLIPRAAC
jgi:hypothetical protein